MTTSDMTTLAQLQQQRDIYAECMTLFDITITCLCIYHMSLCTPTRAHSYRLGSCRRLGY